MSQVFAVSHFKNLKAMLSEIYCLESKNNLNWLEQTLGIYLKKSKAWEQFPEVLQDALILEISYVILKNKHILPSQFFYTLFTEYFRSRSRLKDEDIESFFIELRFKLSPNGAIDESTVLTRVSMELRLGLIPDSIQTMLIPGFLTGHQPPSNQHQIEIRQIWDALNAALEHKLGTSKVAWASEYLALRTAPYLPKDTKVHGGLFLTALVKLKSRATFSPVEQLPEGHWSALISSGFVFELDPAARRIDRRYGLTNFGKTIAKFGAKGLCLNLSANTLQSHCKPRGLNT